MIRPVAAVVAGLLFATVVAAGADTLCVTSASDSGGGTLRDAILKANAAAGSRIEIVLGSEAVILVESALPAIAGAGTRLDGHGVTIREAPGCERPRGKKGCDGIVISAPRVAVRNLRIAGFLFDGVAVRGRNSAGVSIGQVQSIDNSDDGIGVSNGAGPVVVSDCLLMGNGFRTKGKGLLVFDHSEVTLRHSVVVGNRDGVTVTDGSKATLQHVLVAGNYDKGVGVSGASAIGTDVTIVASGRDPERDEAAPNADGLRVGLGGSAAMSNCRIAGNGDAGVVVLDTASVKLRSCVVEANRGKEAVSVAPAAHLSRR